VEPLQTGRGRLCTRQHVITQLMNSEAWSIDKLGFYHQHFEISVRSRLNRLKFLRACPSVRGNRYVRGMILMLHDAILAAAGAAAGTSLHSGVCHDLLRVTRRYAFFVSTTAMSGSYGVCVHHACHVCRLNHQRSTCNQHGDNGVAKEFCFTARRDKLSQ
jgi:hypothetical protein